MRLDKPDTTSRDQIIEKLRTFKNENAEKYGIESMALFGSVAREEHNENSDVDLLIKFKSPSLYLFAELSDALETILGRKMDIVSASAQYSLTSRLFCGSEKEFLQLGDCFHLEQNVFCALVLCQRRLNLFPDVHSFNQCREFCLQERLDFLVIN